MQEKADVLLHFSYENSQLLYLLDFSINLWSRNGNSTC